MFVLLAHATVNHECVPLPKFLKPPKLKLFVNRTMLIFSHCFCYFVTIGSTIQLKISLGSSQLPKISK